jgi:broad specificity phosphatase PhoE
MADPIFVKTVYFVRHGESEGNIGNVHQSGTSPLTQKGHEQAAFISDRVAKLGGQALIVSTMTRTRQTAEYISKKTGIISEFSDLFIEYMPPSELLDTPRYTPHAQNISRQRRENFENSEWHYSDEENFHDLKARALKALELLAQRPEEKIVVVTHGYFLRVILAVAMFGPGLTPKEGIHFLRTAHMENTGISAFGYDPSQDVSPWWLWIWNDHAHLG